MKYIKHLALWFIPILCGAGIGFAQTEPPGAVAPSIDPAAIQMVPVESPPLNGPFSPFAESAGEALMPGGGLDDTRDLLLQPDLSRLPEKMSLEPIADQEEKPRYGSINGLGAEFQVPLGQGRILSLKQDLTEGVNEPLIAIGNPGVIDVAIISDRQLRVTGLRIGVTDLSVTTAKGESVHYEVKVTADLVTLQKKLRVTFPDASVHLSQLQNNVIVEGQARSQMQVTQIIGMITAYLEAVMASQRMTMRGATASTGPLASMESAAIGMAGTSGGNPPIPGGANEPGDSVNPNPNPNPNQDPNAPQQDGRAGGISPDTFLSGSGSSQVTATLASPSIVNLLKVPTSQQVLLKVRIAELNRTGIRNIGANFLAMDPSNGAIFGTQVAGAVSGSATANTNLVGEVTTTFAPLSNRGGTTVFGIFQNANFEVPLSALRRNGLLKILAEPNLVAMSGQPSNFLVGGEYPVPVPQVGASGVAPTITVRFKEFGVRLGFIPYVLDDETLRLTVAPEVSEIDFAIAVSLVSGGSPVPGLNVRRSLSTVEMKHGQTLAIAGLLYLKMDGTSDRIPGLGDLPYLGPFFSNTTNERIEKELVILITPYIVEPMNDDQVPNVPGSDVGEPTDWEFYFLNRIESRRGVDFRQTTAWDNAQEKLYLMKMQKKTLKGEVGFSE